MAARSALAWYVAWLSRGRLKLGDLDLDLDLDLVRVRVRVRVRVGLGLRLGLGLQSASGLGLRLGFGSGLGLGYGVKGRPSPEGRRDRPGERRGPRAGRGLNLYRLFLERGVLGLGARVSGQSGVRG